MFSLYLTIEKKTYNITPPNAESAECRCESTTYPIAAEQPIVIPVPGLSLVNYISYRIRTLTKVN